MVRLLYQHKERVAEVRTQAQAGIAVNSGLLLVLCLLLGHLFGQEFRYNRDLDYKIHTYWNRR